MNARAIHAGCDQGNVHMLRIRFRKLEHAHRVTAGILIRVLDRLEICGARRQRELIAPVPGHHSRILGRRVEALHGPVAPVHKNIIELDCIHLAEQSAITLRAWSLVQIRMRSVGRT